MPNTTISTTPGGKRGGTHILIFPFPAQGHMLPLLDLVHQFAIRATTTTTITVLVTPKNLLILNPLLIQHPSIVQTLVLPFPTPKDSPIPPGVENMKDLPPTYFAPMITTMSKLHDPILNWFQSHPSPPTSIISDFFLGWTQHLASQLGIPRFVFSPCGALTLSLTSLLWCQSQTSTTDGSIHDTNVLVSFPEIPGCPTYPWWQLSTTYRAYVQGKKNGSSNGSDDLELMRNGFVANYLESSGIIFNSFHELEGIYLDHMKQTYFGGNKRLWAIGPLPKSRPTERGGINSDIIPWLDTCEDHSVLYICFGTQAVLSNAQMEALAVGLEKSGVRFVWCVAKPTVGHVPGEYGMVPSWFGDQTAGRGLVIRGWAPQVLILKHKAIGSYLTHCGWNSVLESICAGVPMLGWPMGTDHFTNATLLVDQMKVVVRVCEGEKTIPDVDEFARCLAGSVANSSRNNEMRMRVMALQQAAADAVGGNGNGGGSSFNDLDDLVHHLFSLNY
ncbi:hypothetical protein MKW92_029275 [Papaver armeniacum]|nr:hypothetical protein MKW92_029275 [Papaver armeniacum]